MTRSTSTRRRTVRKTELSPRAVLLAGLGAVSLCRKQALKSVDGLAGTADQLRQRADAASRQAGKRVATLKKQATAFATKAQGEFETRFAPLLEKLGAEPARTRRARPAKRSSRPVAKRTRKRA